jgi:hypothetical protein
MSVTTTRSNILYSAHVRRIGLPLLHANTGPSEVAIGYLCHILPEFLRSSNFLLVRLKAADSVVFVKKIVTFL